MARVCGRFGRKRPFEIYRHLSNATTIAGSITNAIGARPCWSGRRPRRVGIKRLKLLCRLTFSPIYLSSRGRRTDADASLHRDPIDSHSSRPANRAEGFISGQRWHVTPDFAEDAFNRIGTLINDECAPSCLESAARLWQLLLQQRLTPARRTTIPTTLSRSLRQGERGS